MHGARTVCTIWGNYPAFTPQLDPHRTVVHSNIGTQKTANHMSFLQSKVHLDCTDNKLRGFQNYRPLQLAPRYLSETTAPPEHECGTIMNHCLAIHLILYAYVITRAL